MKLTTKMIDIATREVLLNNEDARNIGVLAGDRVQIFNQINGVSVAAFVGHHDLSSPREPWESTGSRMKGWVSGKGEFVEVRLADRPVSLQYIRKKMDGAPLSKDETYSIIRDVGDDNLTPAELTAYITASYIHALDMSGPYPADSLFVGLKENPAFDAYVAMYHDQSHIPIKTVAFDSIAGLIIGTPLVIATVGHGTAFEIAGKGQANPRPMMETIGLVARSCVP